jgi:glycosyltransferase involved in cell wall biosynthesis
MRKLLILPGACETLGGTLVTLSMVIEGFKRLGASEQLRVLVKSGSGMEKYLREVGQESCLQTIPANSQSEFLKRALQWVGNQPIEYPLLLDNCVARKQLPILMTASPALRLSKRPVYHFFHDLALSKNNLGFLARKLAFACLAPRAICNSRFTAGYIHRLVEDIRGILYQPVDLERFNDSISLKPPLNLQPILQSGSRIMLTPSRINKPGIVNNKNLQALAPVLAQLRANGYDYHGVIIGGDRSPNQENSRALLEKAKSLGVADYFTILPPAYEIENYYKYSDVVVTLAPQEPFGRTVVEAIACGVPVVGSRTGGIGEILNNFAPEWTVDPNDSVATAETIVRIATHSSTQSLLTQGQSWVSSQCDLEGYTRRLMEIAGIIPTNQPIATVQVS